MNNTQNSAKDGLHKSKLTDGEEENGRIKKKRFLYVDSLKGLCIILVVVYHCRLTVINDNINQMLLHIRVPMFFFLSGLFFIITFILMFPCIYIFKKYFPYFTAQKELIKFKQKDS
jgi:uncharacterized membrane protein YcfT